MPAHRPGPPRPAPGDAGFSLIETLVALAVISLVMAGTAPFLVQSLSVVSQKRTEQVATETANDALERIRALDPSSLLAGRGRKAAEDQLAAATTAAQDAFAGTLIAGDPLLPTTSTSGRTAALPTEPLPVSIGGAEYQQHWYVGQCWQVKSDPDLAAAVVSDCTETRPTGAGKAVPFFRVVVAVTWQHTSCDKPGPQPGHPADECVYVATALVSTGTDPVFDLKRPAPTIIGPDDQEGYVNVAVNLKLFASGGTLPRTWTVTGLPAGLKLSATSGTITGKPTTAGTYPITVEVKDRDGRTDDATFTWIVAQPPALTTPGTRTGRVGTLDSMSVGVTGGLLPLTWSATGLPAGLSIDPSTGVISGTPTTVETRTVKVTVVDNGKQTKTVTFTWRVFTPVTLSAGTLDARTDPGSYNLTPLAGGGLTPYTWKAIGLPAGMTLDPSTGVVTVATYVAGTRYLATLEVTDAAAGKASAALLINIAPRSAADLQVTAPAPANPDRQSRVGDGVSASATASGGTSGYKWTATGLPTGVTLTAAGAIGGQTKVAGRYVVTLTVTDSALVTAKLMFVWTVTP